ncbi:aldehyde dehydrogenase [Oscillatoria sp. FACHB-1407]|uniref:aldehyde dehydrogenase n=1 Tax=Oscillatoria sp. FACHB-1407 TaxID=2692847 RepID=UPI001687CEA7|nr:aldehyde dehydrogenase [Oscillatoria sp. FACHB-1407]MBD2462972.1 aldehyde dehydrogenase [Oscillatoria sp. FACHB-1407]
MIQSVSPSVSDRLPTLIQSQRQFFATGATKDVEFRIAQLKALRQAIQAHKDAILEALKADLHKSVFEAYAAEIGVIRDIDHALKHIRAWVKPKSVPVGLMQAPGRARIQAEPLGSVLIIGPWNYPIQLMISPLVGAIAAGNCVVLKPSELAPRSSEVIADIIRKTFEPHYIAVVEGGIETSQAVLAQKFDHIFFTGGTAIGKIVMAAAAQTLTPVTLELGGKSPCIVDADIDVEMTARRIAWGKFMNAGQSCIAPDYLLVQRRIKPLLLQAIEAAIYEFYGDDPAQTEDYGRIISDRHTQRLTSLLSSGRILLGGQTNLGDRYIAPTVMDQVPPDSPIMQDEIFGPILPVLEYDELEEAIAFVNDRPKPLALYIFSRNKDIQQRVLNATSSGGACVNDTFLQVGVVDLPFGGVGDSGIGSYHGKASFDTFSHFKSILYKPFWLDFKMRYAPYKDKIETLKKFIR